MSRVELMAPAFDFESAENALEAGADSIYLGMSRLSLRPRRTEPGDEAFRKCSEMVHAMKRKIYGVANVFVKDEDRSNLIYQLDEAQASKVDGLIVADPAVVALIKENYPEIPVHISVQASVMNVEAARFFEDMGAAVIIASRSIPLAEVEKIRKAVSCRLEIFIHGGICYHFDGQCMISSYWMQEKEYDEILGTERLIGQNNTKGECHLICKRGCTLTGYDRSLRSGRLLRRSDLVGIEKLPELIDMGIDVFKIEGRAMPREYIIKAVSLYRKAIDLYYSEKNLSQKGRWHEEIKELLEYRRQYEANWAVK